MIFGFSIVNHELIIVRYGEIALKGRETRKHFESILIKNIKYALKKNNIPNKIEKEWGRIYVYTEQINKSVLVLKKIFGITSISPAMQTLSEMSYISKLSVEVSKKELTKRKSFAIRATRTGKHNFTSQDVAIQIGNDIVKATKAFVNLTKPDFELFIEIRGDKAFIFTKKIRGVSGMPFGSQGRILALIDDKYSILAAWYLIRRGCKVTFIITKKSNLNILNSFIKNWYLDSDIFQLKPGKNFVKEINNIGYEKNCQAIVTSYSLFDKSKKTLLDIKTFKKSINFTVLHPLIVMDKKMINKKCKEIGILL
jgi:thiamine biosynthesis protein ThiI